ncbi:MAG: flagellar hook-length control protein FliK [Clostridiales bacterium]|nr:flagellar hook-length control protein FliK [Clostridiales bacterium]
MQMQMNSINLLRVENHSIKNNYVTAVKRTNMDGSSEFSNVFRQEQNETNRISKENKDRIAEGSEISLKQEEKAVEQVINNLSDDDPQLVEVGKNTNDELLEVDSEEISLDSCDEVAVCASQHTILNLELLLTRLEELLGNSVEIKDIKGAIVEMKLLLKGSSRETETDLITLKNQLAKLLELIEANIDTTKLFTAAEDVLSVDLSSDLSGTEKFNQAVKELDMLFQKLSESLNTERINPHMVKPQVVENVKADEMLKHYQNLESTEKIEVLVTNEQTKVSGSDEKENSTTSNNTNQDENIVIDNSILRDKSTIFTKVDLDTQKNSSTLETKQILEQIVEKVHVNITNNKNEMLIKLTPERLGNVSVNITVEKGLVNATLYAENYQVKEMLENNLDQLRTILIEKGLGIESLNVSVGQHQEQLNKFRHSAFNQSGKKNNKNAGVDVIHQSTIYDDNMINHNPYIKATQFDMLA